MDDTCTASLDMFLNRESGSRNCCCIGIRLAES